MPLFHDPNSAIVALVIGLLGILFEFHAPGSILPGVVGAALVLLSAAALSHYPLSPDAVGLIAAAALLFVLELKVISHGMLAATGAILLACGIYLLVDSPDPDAHIRPTIALGIVLPFGLLTAFLLTIASRARSNKTITGPKLLIGQTGTVAVASSASAALRIQIGGEYWNAVSPYAIVPGTPVRVTAVDGLRLSVIPLSEAGTIP